MASKKTKAAMATGSVQALRIGSRVRCTDDGVEGRIVWANAVAVKIEWTDGEKVTWKREELAKKVEIIDADEEAPPAAPAAEVAAAPAAPEGAAQAVDAQADTPAPGPAVNDLPAAADRAPAFYLPPPEPGAKPAAVPQTPADEEARAVPAPRRQHKAPAEPKEKKPSALDAAAKVLAEEGRPMTTKEMIGAMAIKGYWTSPGGKTPDATLYSAILREITTKGEQSRFVKSGPGHFARRANQ
jgi:hypothetical protein